MLIYLQAAGSDADKAKFVRLYETYKDLMFHTAMQVLHNSADAEDAVHQAFLKIIETFDRIDRVENPGTRAYVNVICRNCAVDLLRRTGRETAAGEIDIPDTPDSPDGDRLREAFARLRPRYRELLQLRYFHGYRIREIAALCHMKRETVKKTLQRAKAALQVLLEEEGASDEEDRAQ